MSFSFSPVELLIFAAGAILFALSLRVSLGSAAVIALAIFVLLVVADTLLFPGQFNVVPIRSLGLTISPFLLIAAIPFYLSLLIFIANLQLSFLSNLASYLLSLSLLGVILTTFIVSFPFIWIFTTVVYLRERSASERNLFIFRRNRPFFYFGTIISEGQLVFDDANQWAQGAWETIAKVAEKFPSVRAERIDITDRATKWQYTKQFLRLKTVTPLATNISILFYVVPVGSNLYIQWWSLLRGRIRWWEVTRFILFAPVSFAFWMLPWLHNEYSIVATLAGTIEYTYDVFDIVAWIISVQNTVFNHLLAWLEGQGVDVSVYRQNPPGLNVVNINGSGNIIGAVAQGKGSRANARVQMPGRQPQG